MGLTHPLAEHAAAAIQSDALVLARRRLRRGTARATTSRFRDQVWSLTPAVHQRQTTAHTLDFRALPEPYVSAVKELMFTLLAGKPMPGEKTASVITIHGYFSALRGFFSWLDQRGTPSLGEITSGDLIDYQTHLLATQPQQARRQTLRRAVSLLWTYRHAMPAGHLAFDPTRLDEWCQDKEGQRRGENKNARIPEQVMAPLLVWTLRFLDDFADDILNALREWARLRDAPALSRDQAQGTLLVRLAPVLDRYRAVARPLPGHELGDGTSVNIPHLSREVGCHRSSLYSEQAMAAINRAKDELGVAQSAWLWTEIRGQLDGRPWRAGISYQELPELVRLLQTAAYITTSYLSGMRDSEVKHIRRRCLRIETDSSGRVCRRKITSLAFKGEGKPTGTRATWVVGEPVVRAIQVLEQIHLRDQNWLFALPPCSKEYAKNRSNQTRGLNQTNKDLNSFRDWINTYCQEHGRKDAIPLVRSRAWRLHTGQFRRTLAWFIARRPGGSIAGAIAYRHLSVQMFEGYAGTSKSGFRAEADQESAIARGEQLHAMVEGHEHEQLHGPSAGEAQARLEKFGTRTRFLGRTPDADQMQKIMKRSDPKIYPGKFVTCSDNPDRRMCERPGTKAMEPNLGGCKPLECRNVALTADNIRSWEEQLASIDHQLALGDRLAPLVLARLMQRRDEIAGLLHRAARPPRPAVTG